LQSFLSFNRPGNNGKTLFQADDRRAVVAKHLQLKYTTRLVLFQMKIIERWNSGVEQAAKEGEV
jgi:hypothetical protein